MLKINNILNRLKKRHLIYLKLEDNLNEIEELYRIENNKNKMNKKYNKNIDYICYGCGEKTDFYVKTLNGKLNDLREWCINRENMIKTCIKCFNKENIVLHCDLCKNRKIKYCHYRYHPIITDNKNNKIYYNLVKINKNIVKNYLDINKINSEFINICQYCYNTKIEKKYKLYENIDFKNKVYYENKVINICKRIYIDKHSHNKKIKNIWNDLPEIKKIYYSINYITKNYNKTETIKFIYDNLNI